MRATSLLLFCLFAPLGHAAEHRPLSVRVFSYVRTPASALREIAARGEEIFRSVGIETRWTACTPSSGDCGELLDGELLLKLVRKPWLPSAGASTFGTVLRDGEAPASFGWIFYDPVETAARANEVSPPVLLAHVMAHEVG